MHDNASPSDDEIRKRTSQLNRVAASFDQLKVTFDEIRTMSTRHEHIRDDLGEHAVQAGRLLIKAIDLGAFPESRSDVNGAWFDRSIGRIPGGVLASVENHDLTIDMMVNQEMQIEAAKELTPHQFELCFLYAIGSWLTKQFPDEFPENASKKNWAVVALCPDTNRPLGIDGKALRGRYYKNNKPLPYGFEPPKTEKLQYSWKLEGECAYEHSDFDDVDWVHRHQVRSRVFASAAGLLARLIGECLENMRDRLPNDESEEGADDELRSAAWFRKKTGGLIEAGLLTRARNDSRMLHGEKRGNRWHYRISDVKRLWPDRTEKLQ